MATPAPAMRERIVEEIREAAVKTRAKFLGGVEEFLKIQGAGAFLEPIVISNIIYAALRAGLKIRDPVAVFPVAVIGGYQLAKSFETKSLADFASGTFLIGETIWAILAHKEEVKEFIKFVRMGKVKTALFKFREGGEKVEKETESSVTFTIEVMPKKREERETELWFESEIRRRTPVG